MRVSRYNEFFKVVRGDDDGPRFQRGGADDTDATNGDTGDTGDTDDTDDETSALQSAGARYISELADLLVEAGVEGRDTLTRTQVLRWLLHHNKGRSLALHLSKQQRDARSASAAATSEQKELSTMTRLDKWQTVAKRYGIVSICKHIIDEGPKLSEHELTKVLVDTVERRQGESAAQAFSRAFCASDEAGVLMRKAIAVTKDYPQMMSIEPVVTGGADATDAADQGTKAYLELMRLAAEQVKRSPTLSVSQAFALVAADQANAQLLADSILRSRARTTSVFPGV